MLSPVSSYDGTSDGWIEQHANTPSILRCAFRSGKKRGPAYSLAIPASSSGVLAYPQGMRRTCILRAFVNVCPHLTAVLANRCMINSGMFTGMRPRGREFRIDSYPKAIEYSIAFVQFVMPGNAHATP